MRELFKRIMLVFLSLIVSLILVEFGYNIFLKFVNPVTIYQPGGKVFSPNGSGEYRGGHVSLDSYGFRNPLDLSDRDMKFLIAGDSFAFGMGINDEEVFTYLLNIDSEKFAIGFINLAHPGYYTIHLVREFFKYESLYDPYDAIIWIYNINDAKSSKEYIPSNIIYPDVKLGPHVFENKIWPYLKTPTLIKHSVLDFKLKYFDHEAEAKKDLDWDFYYQACLATYNPGKKQRKMKKYLKEIIDFARRREVPVFFVLAPVTDQFEDRDLRPQYFIMNTLYENDYKMPILDLFAAWEKYGNIVDYYLPDDHGHLNAKGHRLLAAESKKFVTNNYSMTK